MEGSNTGKWAMIVGGVWGLVGGALLYYYLNNNAGEEEDKFAELHAELEDMGTVNRDASGMVKLDDFLKIFKTVTKHSKKQIQKFKGELTEKRRKCLKEGDEDGYRDCIKQQISQEENIYQEVATEVLNFLEIDEQEFMMSQNMHAMNPAFQRVMMEMQLGVEETTTKPSVSKETAKEIFIFVEEEKSKAMQNMRGAGAMGGMMNPNDMEATINMIVEHSKVGDKLFEKYGIEEEEFAKCIQYYNLIQDPDVQKMMQKSLASMGPEALNMIAQLQGGGAPAAGGFPAGGGMGF